MRCSPSDTATSAAGRPTSRRSAARCGRASRSSASSASLTSACSSVSIQRTTSVIVRPLVAAASSSGARKRAPACDQKSASCNERLENCAAFASRSAVRRAPCQSPQAASGVQLARSTPVVAVGSKTRTSPSCARRASVSRNRSFLTDVARIGPVHSRRAGTARPVVFPVCVGATTMTDCRASAAIRRRWWRPSVTRPAAGLRTVSRRRSRVRAQRAPRPGRPGRPKTRDTTKAAADPVAAISRRRDT